MASDGTDVVDNYRRAASYADRILKGAKPSELPVQAPVKFEQLVMTLDRQGSGLDVPLFFRQRAD